MEEAKKKKLTYEELEQKASEVFMANQKMQQYLEKANAHIEQLEKALEDKEFNTTSFFIKHTLTAITFSNCHWNMFMILHKKTSPECCF